MPHTRARCLLAVNAGKNKPGQQTISGKPAAKLEQETEDFHRKCCTRSCLAPCRGLGLGGSCTAEESLDRTFPPSTADERVSSTLKQQIVQARTAKKMTQAQLAQVGGGFKGRH